VKNALQVCVISARKRGDVLDHMLFAGPPGLGKTTLAGVVANEMGSRMIVINAPTIKKKGELAAVLTSLRRGDILFLDEIHGLHPKIEEILYPAMEDLKLEIVAGNRPLTLELEPFTLIGATTRAGMLQRPLRDRFGLIAEMQPYSVEELAEIVKVSAGKLGCPCDHGGATELARRSQGTPRIANRLMRRIRDYALCAGHESADFDMVRSVCNQLGIDSRGLDQTSRKYLSALVQKGAPVAFNTLVALLGESKDVVEDVIEPYLLRAGMIEMTPKGRVTTDLGVRHMRMVGNGTDEVGS